MNKRIVAISGLALSGVLLVVLLVMFPQRAYRLYANIRYQHPRLMEKDEVRGWKNRPGAHQFRLPSRFGVRELTFDVGPEGDRLLTDRPSTRPPAKRRVVAVGDSITAGWGVRNSETFTALIAKNFPDVQFINHGVGGYSTHQAFLTLKQLYAETPLPEIVLLGLAKHQEPRNTAARYWRSLVYVYGNRGHVKIPYVRLKGDQLVESPAEGREAPYPCRFSAFLCGTYYSWFDSDNLPPDASPEENEKVAEELLARMNDWIGQKKGKLVVVLIDEPTQAYVPLLRARDIPFVTAAPYRYLSDDPHPDQAFHSDVADKVSHLIAPWLGGGHERRLPASWGGDNK